MAGADVLIGTIAVFQYLLQPHVIYQIFPATILAVAMALKMEELRKEELDTYTVLSRLFGTIILTTTAIAGIQSLTNMAYTGEPPSVIPAVVIFIMTATIIAAIENKTKDLAEKLKTDDNPKINVSGYLYIIIIISMIGFLVIALGLNLAATIVTHDLHNLAKVPELIGLIVYFTAIPPSIQLTIGFLKEGIKHKVLVFAITLLLALPLILGRFGANTQSIAAVIGPVVLVAVLWAKRLSETSKEKYSAYLRDIGAIITTFSVLAALPILYLLYNPNSFSIDCTANFQKVGAYVFAYGPQEIIMYPENGKPVVILPWKDYYVDENVFCSAKFKIITSLGQITCNPAEKICSHNRSSSDSKSEHKASGDHT